MAAIREQAIEAEQETQAVDFVKKRAAFDEQQMLLAEAMIAKVEEMLDYPVSVPVERTVEWHDPEKKYPKTVHVFNPGRWTFNTASVFLTIAMATADQVMARPLSEQVRRSDPGDLHRRVTETLERLEKEARLTRRQPARGSRRPYNPGTSSGLPSSKAIAKSFLSSSSGIS